MSLTVIQYGDTVRLSVMTDARLTPSHTIPAARWPLAVEQLVAKVDQEIARISAQSASVPTIVTTHEPRSIEDTPGLEGSESMGSLRPPQQTIVSPPPMRRRITHH